MQCGWQLEVEWPVEFWTLDKVGKELEKHSRVISSSTAKLIRCGCVGSMLAGYSIPIEEDVGSSQGP
jgi:hypothetical protein